MRCDTLVDRVGVCPVGEAYLNVGVLQPKARIDIGGHLVVRAKNVLNIDVHEIVKGVYMLLHKTFDLEEGWKEKPFVLCSVIMQPIAKSSFVDSPRLFSQGR